MEEFPLIPKMRTLLDTSYELLTESNDRIKQTFCASVLLGQVGHNIMITNWQVLMESLSSKDAASDDTGASVLGQGFVFLAVATSFDFLGTSFGGYLVKCGCPVGKLLPLSMAFRFLTTAICWIYYLISYTHTPYPLLFAAFIAIDFFFVGVLDSSRSILVVLLEPDSLKRKVFNSNIEACFQIGNVLGPLVGAIILTVTNGSLSLALPLPPSFFLIVAVLYMNFSRFSQPSVSDPFTTTKRTNNNYLSKIVLFLISGCLQLNRMKSILPSVMVHLGEGDNPVWAIGWITACFGIGNTVGSYVSRHVPSEWSSYALLSGALSTLLFALFPVLQNIYQGAIVVFFANILVGVAFVQLNVEIQQLFSDKLWLIGVNRAYMRFCLLVQKVFISLALSGALSSMGSSLDLLSGMFSVLTAIQLTLGIIRLKMK